MIPEWLTPIIGPALAAMGVYVGIRVDLAVSREKATHALNSATKAHERIDKLQQWRGSK